ncbi:cell wall-binding repeat-containing protein [Leifsonia shinshuensis]|uniref:cell wall-binding repeat-containing protein n=1 Tax=Leifsonia shinshuensis TaxID=150026 RepID=UPI0028628E1C|nr:cell wall-binding repeat-containing protein [Leifsonia shinshuensis]MDR6972692.1 putative cell wall-binding protein [Leifsonia shinshuensis]
MTTCTPPPTDRIGSNRPDAIAAPRRRRRRALALGVTSLLAASGIVAVGSVPAGAATEPAPAPTYVAFGHSGSDAALKRVIVGHGDTEPTDVRFDQWVDPTSAAIGNDGDIYVSDTGAHTLYRIDASLDPHVVPLPSGTVPGALAVDGQGTVSVYDSANQRIVRVGAQGTVEFPVTGPLNDLAVGADGDLFGYRAQTGSIVHVDLTTGQEQPVASAAGAKGLAIDASGNFYTTVPGTPSQVLKIGPGNTKTPISGAWSMPSGVAVGEDGSLYVANTGAGAIRIVAKDGSQRVTPFDGLVPLGVAVAPSAPAFTSEAPTGAPLGQSFRFAFHASGVPAPVLSISSDSAVPGLQFDATTGTLAGTPSAPGTHSFTVTARNASGTATQHVDLTVGSAPVFGTITSPQEARVGSDYSASFPATGSPAPTYSAAGLPEGLSIDTATGMVSGKPKTVGEYSYTVTATNAVGAVTTAAQKLTVSTGELVVDRVSGADRYDTSVQVSREAFADDSAKVVFVASGNSFADALSAGPAAAKLGGPVLLTAPGALPGGVADEIRRLGAKRVVVVGGNAVVSDSVLASLAAIVPDTVRVGGADRFATSRAIAQFGFGSQGASDAVVATGLNFPDALSAGAAIGARGPVVLVNGGASDIDTDTRALLGSKGLGVKNIWIAGGTAVVSPGIQSGLGTVATTTRLAGSDRYGTSEAINAAFFSKSGADRMLLATGTNFPDALSGGAWAGSFHGPLSLSPGGCVPQGVLSSITSLGVSHVTLLGGEAALSPAVEKLTAC